MKHCHLIAALTAAACAEHSEAESGRDSRVDTRQEVMLDAAQVRPSDPPATVKEYVPEAPWFNIYRREDLSVHEATMPVIVWANGVCSRSDFAWESMFRYWASAGFVVLALTENPGDSSASQTTVADQAGLIDWVVRQADVAGGPYFGKLATDRIVAAGNSCGGVTTLRLTASDTRVAAAFVLSGSSGDGAADSSVVDRIRVPVGYIIGGAADVVGENAKSDYERFRLASLQ